MQFSFQKNNKQRAESKEQRAESGERRAGNREQQYFAKVISSLRSSQQHD
jgi:hypothetical protein